jgi:hypothetical protein
MVGLAQLRILPEDIYSRGTDLQHFLIAVPALCQMSLAKDCKKYPKKEVKRKKI